MMPLLFYYEEPQGDRWIPFDRHPRALARRILGRVPPSGHRKVFENLVAGLRKAGIAHAVNNWRRLRADGRAVVCVLGKPHLLDERPTSNPIMFGPAIFSHPVDDPTLLERTTVRRIVVPGEWPRAMWAEHWGDRVAAWPVGIDTDEWTPGEAARKRTDVLLYNKVRWDHARMEAELLEPIRAEMRRRGLTFEELRYGSHREADLRRLSIECRAMVFVCEHETQGIAYQQTLSAGLPILAWDRGGEWRDPNYWPEKVRFGPVSSVPYFDERCGLKFADAAEFAARLDEFLDALRGGGFAPRDYILDNLELADCARRYVALRDRVAEES